MIVDTLPNGYWPLQIVGGYTIQHDRRKLLADHPGAGKTLQALLGIEIDGGWSRPTATLITAPKTACQLTWAGELEKRIASQYACVIADLTGTLGAAKRRTSPSVAERNTYLGAKIAEAARLELPLVVLVNFDGLRWPPHGAPKMTNLWSIFYDHIIIDESHLVLPTKVDTIDKLTQFWRGLAQIQTVANPILLSISGTPDRGQLANRYGHWKFLFKGVYRGYSPWVKSLFETYFDGYQLQVGRLKDEATWVGFDRLNMLRRTKREMLAGLPEKQWAGDDGAIHLPPSEGMLEQLAEFEEEMEAKLAAEEISEASARMLAYVHGRHLSIGVWNRGFNKKWTMKRPVDSPIVDWIEQFLEERGHHPDNFDPALGKVIITSYFTEVLAAFQEELQARGFGRIPILSGDTPLHEKQAIEAEFQRGDLRLILFSGHLGVSINLDAADDMVFTDLVHDPDKIEQTEDRIHRASRMHQVTYWRLVVDGTLMEDVLASADSRYLTTRRTYDGSRGVEYLRRMLGDFEGLAA